MVRGYLQLSFLNIAEQAMSLLNIGHLQAQKEQPHTPGQQIRVQPELIRPLQALSRYKGRRHSILYYFLYNKSAVVIAMTQISLTGPFCSQHN